MSQQVDVAVLLAHLPTPQAIRDRLAALSKEMRILRQLLKLAEQEERRSARAQEVAHA